MEEFDLTKVKRCKYCDPPRALIRQDDDKKNCFYIVTQRDSPYLTEYDDEQKAVWVKNI